MFVRFHFASAALAVLIAVTTSATGQAHPILPSKAPPAVALGRTDVILAASNDQCTFRCRILREECVEDKASASQPDDTCWSSYSACRADCGNGVNPINPANPAGHNDAPDSVVREPGIINVGKWAEGAAFDGTSMWVAESGQRTIAKIDSNGRVIDRARVGRLPVAMVSNGDGIVYSLVHTDQLVWRQPNNGRGGVFARLGTCPQAMAISGRHLWALTLPSCSSESSQLVRIDVHSGRQARSQVLGEWGQAVTTYGDQVWVAHARGPAITVLDQNSLGAWTLNVPGASLWSITTNATNVYAGGRVDENNQDGLVVMMDPQGQQELFRTHLSERIAEIAATNDHVVAVGEQGTMWVLSARDLHLQRTITLSTGAFEPRSAAFLDGFIVVTSATFSGENGAVLAVRDWRPDTASAPNPPITRPANCSQIQNAAGRAVCENRDLKALDDEINAELVLAIINTTSEAVGGTLDDAVALYKEQRAWLLIRDRCGADLSCLRPEYQARLIYMKDLNQPE